MISFEPQEYINLPVLKIIILDDTKEIGFYLLVPQAIDIYEVHTHMTPEAFGSALEISKKAMRESFSFLPEMNTLVTKVPINNPLAKRLSLKVGMKLYGRLPKSFRTEENWIDQELFYINREDTLCQQP